MLLVLDLGGTAVKYGKNIKNAGSYLFGKRDKIPSIAPHTNGITTNTTIPTVNPKGGIDIKTPLNSDFNSMGGLSGTPPKPTFTQSVSRNFEKIKGSVSVFEK